MLLRPLLLMLLLMMWLLFWLLLLLVLLLVMLDPRECLWRLLAVVGGRRVRWRVIRVS